MISGQTFRGDYMTLVPKALLYLFIFSVVTAFVPHVSAQQSSNTSNASSVNDGIWTYRKFLSAGEYEKAESSIQKIKRSGKVPTDDQWRLMLDLAKASRFQGKLSSAASALDQIKGSDALRPLVRIEAAWQSVLAGKGDDVLMMLEALSADSDVEVRCHAGYLLGKILFAKERIQPTLDACDKAIRDFRKVDFYHNPYDWELFILRRELQKLRAEARDFNILHKYGEDYANYRRGRFAQSRGDFVDAIRYYRLIKGPILSDAAQCYIGACLRDSGMEKQAAEHWEAFIQSDQTGLYRGEAMYQLGEMLLLHTTTRNQLVIAEQWLKRAVDWDQTITSSLPPVTADSIKEVLKAFPVASESATRDRYGNFHRQRVGPETIVNRLTATWYLKDLHLKASSLYAFALFELKDPQTEIAMQKVIRLSQLNPGLLYLGDTPQRLVKDAKNGAFVFPKAVWNGLTPTNVVSLHLACYQLRTGQFGDAKNIFIEVLGQLKGKSEDGLDWSMAQLGLAYVDFNQGKMKEALARLSQFESTKSQSPLAAMGVLWAANIYAGQPDGLLDAQTRYAKIIKQMPNSVMGDRALLSLAIASENSSDRKNAIVAVNALRENSSNTKYLALAETLAAKFNGISIQPRSSSKSDVLRGRIVPFDRHLVIPGHVDLTLDLSQFALNDLVNYEIAYSIRAGCSLRSFGYRSSIDEPQVPSVGESPLRFLRAPLLIMAD